MLNSSLGDAPRMAIILSMNALHSRNGNQESYQDRFLSSSCYRVKNDAGLWKGCLDPINAWLWYNAESLLVVAPTTEFNNRCMDPTIRICIK